MEGEPRDRPVVGVDGGERFDRPGTGIFVLDLERATGTGRAGGRAPRARLQRGLLVQGPH
ncbi:MAG: hypothetical protein U0531_14230 [Dehalococcoidia bacterium]